MLLKTKGAALFYDTLYTLVGRPLPIRIDEEVFSNRNVCYSML